MPWLACGGGGYNLDVAPRSWALAFAAMSGQTLPDALPQPYRDVYRGEWLHDRRSPHIDAETEARARKQAEFNDGIVSRQVACCSVLSRGRNSVRPSATT